MWFFNFLSDRCQFVRVRGGYNCSNVAHVVSGVLQETVLGPLFFLILMTDISTNVTSILLVLLMTPDFIWISKCRLIKMTCKCKVT